ncbi:hypothetical protein AX16_007101 [Volvariella volvacea WC 439]|nr:hypothetical protein AX16_007101 [Volvariella volvacea WC 439]
MTLRNGYASICKADAPPAHRVPPELWFEIFSLACTDGGFTGTSLSRASHHVRLFLAPYKFQHLKVFGLAQACLFNAALKKSTQSDICIRTLFFSALPLLLKDDQEYKYTTKGPSILDEITNLHAAYFELLEFASPTLEILHEYRPTTFFLLMASGN